jgi:hypothetical protein
MFIILLPCHPVSDFRLAAISRPNYTRHVCKYLREEFPNMVSYQRFADPQIKIVSPMAAFPHFRLESCAGISFIDSTPIRKSG